MPTALFLGRFQPPHVGHILTLRRLAQNYDKVIVGVTEAQPSVMQTSEVIGILRLLVPEENFEIVPVQGSVEAGSAIINFPFDVCCSGNVAVLNKMADRGFKTEFIERSLDSIFSGTRERQLYVETAVAAASRKTSPNLTEFSLVETDNLRPIERINPCHFAALENEILRSGIMQKPLIVDRVTLAVLDGSHRYAFLVKHGYKLSPTILCDYDDESIFVGNHLGHRFQFDDEKWISKKHVRATAISGQLYEPRTTRHFFPFRKVDNPVSLESLSKGTSRSVDHLTSQATPEGEIISNEGYISELTAELAVLNSYVNEQMGVMAWLNQQNALIAEQARREMTAQTADQETKTMPEAAS